MTLPNLLVNKRRAKASLTKQINEGNKILSQKMTSDEEIRNIHSLMERWHQFNGDMLTSMFDSSSISINYLSKEAGYAQWNPTVAQRVEWIKDQVGSQLNELQSIFERIDLYKTVRQSQSASTTKVDLSNQVFIVHGRNNEIKLDVARTIEKFGLKSKILHEEDNKGDHILTKFERHALTSGYAVVILSADDIGGAKNEANMQQPRARQNVVLELGYFLHALGKDRVLILREDKVEIPSDIAGLHYVIYDEKGAWKTKLGKELKAAGLHVDLNDLI